MKRHLRIAVLCLSASATIAVAAEIARRWPALEQDGVHDPKGPAVHMLQQPREALSALPAAPQGNQVNWIEALEKGHINPRTNVFPETNVRVRDTDVLLNLTGSTPIVRFPHRAHTLWLDCSNCHDQLFKAEAGANKFSMERILSGEQCGVCHGAVAFPLTECSRCHSVARDPPVGRSR
jgi:c(7)-type cytochrome triheme protein